MDKKIIYGFASLILLSIFVPIRDANAVDWFFNKAGGISNPNTGNVGIGIVSPLYKLHVLGTGFFDVGGSGGGIFLGTPGGESGLNFTNTNRADIRFNNSTLKLVVGSGIGVPPATNGIAIDTSGRVGIGTNGPNAKLDVVGTIGTSGSSGTAFTQSISAIGWYEKTVTFPTTFATNPDITLTQDNSGTGDISIISFRVKKNSISTTGFTIQFYVNAVPQAGTTNFHWIALQ